MVNRHIYIHSSLFINKIFLISTFLSQHKWLSWKILIIKIMIVNLYQQMHQYQNVKWYERMKTKQKYTANLRPVFCVYLWNRQVHIFDYMFCVFCLLCVNSSITIYNSELSTWLKQYLIRLYTCKHFDKNDNLMVIRMNTPSHMQGSK